MTEQKQADEPIAAPKELSTLEKIQLLGNLANSVQDEAIKAAFTALPSGEQLYSIFVSAVSKEIETMMSPSKEAPKELMDTLSVASSLREQITHMYQAMAELSRTQLIGVLNVLNTSLGGRPIPANPAQGGGQQRPEQGQQPVAPRQQPVNNNDDNAPRNVIRSSETGISW